MRSNGSLYQIDEDENGTYIMNAKDLRLIQYLKEISNAGVCSLKVEGRTKSLNYVALVAKAYRKAIDDMWSGKNFDPELLTDLDKVANRGYDTGFMIRDKSATGSAIPNATESSNAVGLGTLSASVSGAQNYHSGVSRNFSQKFGGLLLHDAPVGFIAVEVRNKIVPGQVCEILTPEQPPHQFVVKQILNKDKNLVDAAQGGTGLHYFEISESAQLANKSSFGILSILSPSEHQL